eukprot:jgi/Bigna1/70582/fgenesh1_pg.12_\
MLSRRTTAVDLSSRSMSEDSFLQKWKGVVTRVDLIEPTTAKDLEKAEMTHIKDAKGSATKPFAMLIEAIEQKKTNATRIKDTVNPFEMLIQAIQQITGAWESIVNAFKSTYEEQLLDTHLNNGWSKYKQATKVFKGAGLAYDKTDEFFADIQSMINIPDKYNDDFNKQIEWIKFFDNTTWSGHDTQFSQGKGGSDTIFTMYARNREDDGKIDVLFLTCSQEFELADDYFVISEHKSILGGLFDHTKIKFKKKPAAISDKDLMFVSEYFSLLAYQQIALAEGISAPPDPQFPPSLSDLMEAS